MTTEIAVLNRLGIALATDSAVTIGGSGGEKVFDTADKLFELSPKYAVALMINGNMDCLGVPWEIIIKDFREAEGNTQRETIKDWMESFLSFVSLYKALSDQKAQEIIKEKVDGLCVVTRSEIMDRIFRSPEPPGRGIKKRESFQDLVKSSILDLLSKNQELYEGQGKALSLVDLDENEVCQHHSIASDGYFRKQFEPHSISDEEISALKKMALTLIFTPTTTDYTTGIVIAGYGRDSTFPAIESVEVEGKVKGILKYAPVNSYTIEDAEDAGQVVSYAQTDVIERLLGGADPSFVHKSASFVREAIIEAGTAIESALRPGRLSQEKLLSRLSMLEEIGELFAQKYMSEAAPELIKASTAAFDRMIALMPKQELINLAEALVNITAVERKASSDPGTVGGPIDVALITKHEGFVWIKRKQHFDPNLNPRYFWRRYGRGAGGGQDGEGSSYVKG